MTFAAALAALEARQEARIELGLDRVLAHLARLGDPQERVPAIHVAGTNGKGSTCAILDSVLRASGRRVGLYISPHLRSVRERIRVGGRAISELEFARCAAKAFAADPQQRLTYFELTTSIAFQYFAERRCDIVVLETGLGGLLDATNVLRSPLAAVVTSVDMDHMNFLGGTRRKIAVQKAGIFKPGRPAIFRAGVFPRGVKIQGTPRAVRRPWTTIGIDWRRGSQRLLDPQGKIHTLSLLGSRQGSNVALAQAALEAAGFDIPMRAWSRGLATVRWPGRFQALAVGRGTLIIDGAHNPEAARALAETWRSSPWSRRPARWILGLLRDKDAAGVLAPVAKFLRDVVVVRPASARALEPLALADAVRRAAPRARVTVERDVTTALAQWRREAGAPPTAVCAGSLYLAGEALAAVGARP